MYGRRVAALLEPVPFLIFEHERGCTANEQCASEADFNIFLTISAELRQ